MRGGKNEKKLEERKGIGRGHNRDHTYKYDMRAYILPIWVQQWEPLTGSIAVGKKKEKVMKKKSWKENWTAPPHKRSNLWKRPKNERKK